MAENEDHRDEMNDFFAFLATNPGVMVIEPATAEVQRDIKANNILGPNAAPHYELSGNVDASKRELFERTLAPVLRDVTSAMQSFYGILGSDGSTISVEIADARGDAPYAYAKRKMKVTVGENSTSKTPFSAINATAYDGIEFGDSPDWAQGTAVEFCAHELGHALIGAGAPQHEPIQEAIAQLNEIFMHREYKGALAESPLAFKTSDLEGSNPQILAGKPGWGVPEHAAVEKPTYLAHTLYAAYTTAMLQALGDINNAPIMLRAAMQTWNKLPQDEEGMRVLPHLKDWLQEMDDALPGFGERYLATGMYQEEGFLPEGERIVWREMAKDTWEVAAVHITRNPSFMRPESQQSRFLDMTFAKLLPVDGKITILIPGAPHALETNFIGQSIIERNIIAEAAKSAGITLTSGMKLSFIIEGKELTGEKTLIW